MQLQSSTVWKSMKPSKFKRYLEIEHSSHKGKPVEFVKRKLDTSQKNDQTHVHGSLANTFTSYKIAHPKAKCKETHTVPEDLV